MGRGLIEGGGGGGVLGLGLGWSNFDGFKWGL